MSEVLTGDMPTPVKYHNEEIKTAYKKIEAAAERSLLSSLEDDMRSDYESLCHPEEEEHAVVKAADKLCAYLKCLQEESRGNREFASAKESIKRALDENPLPELKYFMEHYLSSFSKNLDEVSI